MGRVKKTDTSAQQATVERSWQEIIAARIRKKKVVPIISNRLAADHVLNGYDALLDAYVEYVLNSSSFLLERRNFSQMLQFRNVADPAMRDPMAIKDDFINFIKNRLFDLAEEDDPDPDTLEDVDEKFDETPLSDFATALNYPNFSGEKDPYLLLASFELPIYITTTPYDFIEQALRLNGKEPRTEICRWKSGWDNIPSPLDAEYDPGDEKFSNEPLVYHLYGHARHPKSLVLTEDDYMQFMVATNRDVGRATDPVPRRIRQAMSDSSLLLLGYQLDSWELRSLFWGMIVPRTQKLQGAVNIQLEPSELERLYLERYMNEYKLEVYWGDVQTALQGVREEL